MADTQVSLATRAGQTTLQYGQHQDALGLWLPTAPLGHPENNSAEMTRVKTQDLVEKSEEGFNEATLQYNVFCVTIREDGSHQKEKTWEDLADLSSRYSVLPTPEFERQLTVGYKTLPNTCKTEVLKRKKKCPPLVLCFWDNSGPLIITWWAGTEHQFIYL